MSNYTAKAADSKPAKPQTAAVSSTATKSAPGSKPNSLLASSLASVTAEVRQAMIAEAAYYIAEQRGFGEGRGLEDWLLAEKQVDAKLTAHTRGS
jgi:hypothetical protein